MRKRLRANRTRSWLSTLWRQHLTPAGKALLGLLFVSLPGLTDTDSGLLVLLAAIISGFLIAIAVGWIFRPRIDLIGQPVARIMAAEPTSIVCRLQNSHRFPCFGLQLRWIKVPDHWGQQEKSAVLARLAPGEAMSGKALQTGHRGKSAIEPVGKADHSN